jgi:signal transduction histidine kinase/predicted hydrocarbon binding protein/ActR/RegA family two-component response regulator
MPLKTVKVPSQLELAFTQIESIVSNFFNTRMFKPEQGTIEIGDERYILIRGAALSIEFFALIKRLFGPGRESEAHEFARNMLFDLAHAIGKSDAEKFHAKMHLKDPIAKLSAGPIHFAYTGWAFVDILPESNPSTGKDYCLVYDHPYSFEADAWVRNQQTAETPVCVMNAGYSAGWCEASFGLPLAAVEILCRAAGDHTCRFIMAPPETIANRVEEYSKDRPEISSRLKESGLPHFFNRKFWEERLQQNEMLGAINRVLEKSLTCQNEEELAQLCLSEAQSLTKSKFGFIGEVNKAGSFDLIAISNPGWNMCGIPKTDAVNMIQNMQIRGIWGSVINNGKSLLTNDPYTHPDSVGTPEGHPQLTSFLGVPLQEGGKTVGMIALGNKESGYDDTDQKMIESLVATFTEALMRKRTECQLAKAKEAAEAASRAKSSFLANMSHEIRTPMTAILGFTDILMGNPSRRELNDAAGIIKRNGESLLAIINDILSLSKIETGKFEIQRVVCSPGQIASEVLSTMKIGAEAKGLSISLEYAGNVPESVKTDPTSLRQILVNLIGNAIKFTEKGGVRIVVRSGIGAADKPKLYFDIIDTGIGLSEEQIGLLFQPFSQVDSSMRRRYGGSGLGLAVSGRLATMLGGDITVSSILGEGSKFTLAIDPGPLEGIKLVDRPIEIVQPHKQTEPDEPKLNCRILLAEDSRDNQRFITFVLSKAGADVTVVENGKAAVDLALTAKQRNNPFDVILMDMQMPVMDGFEATRNLRKAGYTKSIIALTAQSMAENYKKCIDAGCNTYIIKPINQIELLKLLKPFATKHVSV